MRHGQIQWVCCPSLLSSGQTRQSAVRHFQGKERERERERERGREGERERERERETTIIITTPYVLAQTEGALAPRPLSCLSRQRSGWRATRGSRWSGGVGFAMEGGRAVGGMKRDGLVGNREA